MTTNNYDILIKAVVKAQEEVLGPLANEIAYKVLIVGPTVPNKEVLGKLVNEYKFVFGQASVETCKDAVRGLKLNIKDEDLPDILKKDIL